MIPGGGSWGGGITDLSIKSQQSLNVTALQEKNLRLPNKAEAPPVTAAGAWWVISDLLLFLTLKNPFDTLK